MSNVRDSPASENAGIVVDAPGGAVRGIVTDGVAVFLGIPYAEAPVGDLRFAPPRSAAPWDGVRDAIEFGSISVQDIDPVADALPGTEYSLYASGTTTSEDCLNLNVWTPDASGVAPVLVWIHGGAFMYGSGTSDWANGANHARDNGIVVVTINYRLGILGGLFLGDYDEQASNFGLQDQMLALRWVRENIAAFGGDATRVTVGGQSAGALSVAGLLAAPGAHDLFIRAIVESGHSDAGVDLEFARRSTARVLERLHIAADDPDVLSRLREASVLRIAAVQREFGISTVMFPLVKDDVILNASPLTAIAAGCARDVTLMIGTSAEEDRLFAITGWAPTPRPLRAIMSGILPPESVNDAVELYASVPYVDDADLAHIVATDHAWSAPTRVMAAAQASAGGKAYLYRFAWKSTALNGRVGAAHMVELPFFLNNLRALGTAAFLGPEIDTDPTVETMALAIATAIGEFVRDGEPRALGAWTPYSEMERVTMVIDRVSGERTDLDAERLAFWDSQRAVATSPLASLTGER